jgi:hypothetical protein
LAVALYWATVLSPLNSTDSWAIALLPRSASATYWAASACRSGLGLGVVAPDVPAGVHALSTVPKATNNAAASDFFMS